MKQLSHFFHPKSIAVIGASIKPCKPGNVLVSNLLRGGFNGVVMPVSPKYQSVCGILTYPSISELPLEPDIAVLCTPAHANLTLFKQLAERNTKNVIVLSAYMDLEKSDLEKSGTEGSTEISLAQQCIKIAQRAGMRVLGPSSLGLILPWIGLNASFSPVNAKQGNIAFISQSASVCTTILDWAQDNQVGFSAFVSLGETSDISFSDMLDWFATDPKTEAIMLYVDSIDDARQFLSSARAASRYRRVLVLKAGKSSLAQTTRANSNNSSSSNRSSGNSEALDVIFDSAIRRAGMLRVNTTHEMFAAAKTLNHSITAGRERIAIITNAHGPSIIALDTLDNLGGRLANIDQALSSQLVKIHHFNHEAIAKLTHIDYDREMAFVAVRKCDNKPAILGVSRIVVDVNFESAEFAILIRSDLNHQGLGKVLMTRLIQYCQMQGIKRLIGETMPGNQGMLSLAEKLGFELDVDFAEGTANMILNIEPPVLKSLQ